MNVKAVAWGIIIIHSDGTHSMSDCYIPVSEEIIISSYVKDHLNNNRIQFANVKDFKRRKFHGPIKK